MNTGDTIQIEVPDFDPDIEQSASHYHRSGHK